MAFSIAALQAFYATHTVLVLGVLGAVSVIILTVTLSVVLTRKSPAAAAVVPNDYFGPSLPNVFYKTRAFTGVSNTDGRYYAFIADLVATPGAASPWVQGTTMTDKYYLMWFGPNAAFGTQPEAAAMITTPYNATTAVKMYELHNSVAFSDFSSIQQVPVPSS